MLPLFQTRLRGLEETRVLEVLDHAGLLREIEVHLCVAVVLDDGFLVMEIYPRSVRLLGLGGIGVQRIGTFEVQIARVLLLVGVLGVVQLVWLLLAWSILRLLLHRQD